MSSLSYVMMYVTYMVAAKHTLTASYSYKVTTIICNFFLKQLKVNHKHYYHVIKNNSQARIEDKEQKIRINEL